MRLRIGIDRNLIKEFLEIILLTFFLFIKQEDFFSQFGDSFWLQVRDGENDFIEKLEQIFEYVFCVNKFKLQKTLYRKIFFNSN